MNKELAKDDFFKRLKTSFETGCIDGELTLIAKESIWSHWYEEPIIEMNTKSIDYFFSKDDGIISFVFPSSGLEVEVKISVYTCEFLSIETRDGDIIDCGQYGEKLVCII